MPDVSRPSEPLFNAHNELRAVAFVPHFPLRQLESRRLRVGPTRVLFDLAGQPEEDYAACGSATQIVCFPIDLIRVVEFTWEATAARTGHVDVGGQSRKKRDRFRLPVSGAFDGPRQKDYRPVNRNDRRRKQNHDVTLNNANSRRSQSPRRPTLATHYCFLLPLSFSSIVISIVCPAMSAVMVIFTRPDGTSFAIHAFTLASISIPFALAFTL